MQIVVTADHIALGVPCDGACCPVALAIKDAAPHLTNIYVTDEDASWGTVGARPPFVHAYLPEAVGEFINAFDNGDADVGPFAFELALPEAA